MEAFSSQGDGTLTSLRKQPHQFRGGTDPRNDAERKQLTLDSKTGHILLITAEYTPPALLRPPAAAGGRGQMVPDSFSIVVVGK